MTAQSLGKNGAVMNVLWALTIAHLLNDTIQSLLPAIYPVLKNSFRLSFVQVGLLTLAFQATASLLQPLVGAYTDRKPKPYSLALGMAVSLLGLFLLSRAPNFESLLLAAALIGIGSSIFHPEASRIARMASGGRHGFAQALFQVGGNFGSSIGPLIAAWIIVPYGQRAIIWCGLLALLGFAVLLKVGEWYQSELAAEFVRRQTRPEPAFVRRPRRQVVGALVVLGVLMFSKYFYLVSLSNYYTFYLIERFHVSVQSSQIFLFVFLFSVAAGTILGGPVGDRYGKKFVIWVSILGVAPFSLLLPQVNLAGTVALTIIIGLILASAFSAILVYAQELVPGKVGMIAGLFFGVAFGLAGVGSALLGWLADYSSIIFVFKLCAFLPLLGLITALLPDIESKGKIGA